MNMKCWFLMIWIPLLAEAVPQPPCIYYGQAKDAYGHPYLSNAKVALQNGTNELDRFVVDGLYAPGVNFKLKVEIGDSGAVSPGDLLGIKIWVDGLEVPILEASMLESGESGDIIPLSITTGADSDGDGLPDEWEQQMIAASGGEITDITQLNPQDDFDGDGASNRDEYLAGTFAFLDYDYFCIRDLERTDDGRFAFRFLSNAGMSYQVETCSDLGDDSTWTTALFALEATEPSIQNGVTGDGYFKTLFIKTAGEQMFMRLVVK
jgi:hypothetical protein